MVSKENSGARTTRLVRAAFRHGRSQFDFLFGPGHANGRPVVRDDAERFHFRCKAASTLFVSLHVAKIVAARIATARASRRKREGECFADVAPGATPIFSAADVDLAIRWKTWRISAATFVVVFAAESCVERARTFHRGSI